MAKVTIAFTLDDDADKDLVRWLDGLGNRSAGIRQAIREHMGRNGVSLSDVYQAVKDLERKIKTGAVVVGDEQARDFDEPADVAAALNALADL